MLISDLRLLYSAKMIIWASLVISYYLNGLFAAMSKGYGVIYSLI
jgi:hypothetical protein